METHVMDWSWLGYLLSSITAVIGTAGGAVAGYWLKRAPQAAKERSDAFSQVLAEYKDLVKLTQADKITLNNRVWALEKEHARCLAQNERLERLTAENTARIEFLQTLHDPERETEMVADVVSDQRGMIVDWDPSATALFGWNRSEAIGRPLTMLMPDVTVGMHQTAFDRMLQHGRDPRHGIITGIARNKRGEELRVAIVLSSWGTGEERRFGATIRRRRNGAKA